MRRKMKQGQAWWHIEWWSLVGREVVESGWIYVYLWCKPWSRKSPCLLTDLWCRSPKKPEEDVRRTWERNRWLNTALQSWIPPTWFEVPFCVNGCEFQDWTVALWGCTHRLSCKMKGPWDLGASLKPMGYHIVMGVLSQLTWVFIIANMATSVVKPAPQVVLVTGVLCHYSQFEMDF